MSEALKPCPCGKVPDKLYVTDSTTAGKYYYVTGDCCAEWHIEFRADYLHLRDEDRPELERRMARAWNEAPRSEQEGK